MPNIYFVVFEVLVYTLFALCFRQAWKAGVAKTLRLVLGAVFGVLLELATIRQLNSYHYGQFGIMLLDVPLCIGVAWSVIIYSAMEFSDSSNLPYWLRPILDGLLALSIDLAFDSVAIRLGMWDWGRSLEYQYFGVPFANFWAWFWVVTSFSFGYRLLARRSDWIGNWLSPFLALFIGLAGVLGTNALIVFVIPVDYRPAVIAFVLLGALAIVSMKRPNFYQKPVAPLVFWIPLIFHLYFLSTGIVSGVIFRPLILLLVSLLMLVISLLLHQKSLRQLVAGRENHQIEKPKPTFDN